MLNFYYCISNNQTPSDQYIQYTKAKQKGIQKLQQGQLMLNMFGVFTFNCV